MNDQSMIEQELIQELGSLRQRISELEGSESKLMQMEDELCESEEEYRNVLENIEDGYFEVDRAGDFTFFNFSLCRILGYTREEMMGMNYKALMDTETANKAFQSLHEVYVTGIPLKGSEWRHLKRTAPRYIPRCRYLLS